MEIFNGAWLAALVALVPAVFRLIRGRSLARHADDPALAERIAAGTSAQVFVFSSVLTVLLLLWRQYAAWAIPLQILAFMAARWPLRRALFHETWSIVAYLWFYVRLIVAIYGFWIVLVAAPWLMNLDGMRGWVAPAVLLVVLLAWNDLYGLFLRTAMRTRPVTTPDLLERFAAVVARTTVRPPNIEYVDMRGGVFVNAMVLPDTNRASVLFTSTLLERLDTDEIVGVFAHEMAHLEYFSPAYLRRHRVVGWLVLAASVVIAPLIHRFAPGAGVLITVWPLVTIGYLLFRGQQRQTHETDSDLRAVALTGDPEALVRGLTKLHALMKLPRRLDPNVEVHASHPSLARRIKAIRAASGTTVASLDTAAVFTSGSKTVTLHADRVVWSEGEVSSFTLPYSSLDGLRVDVDSHGSPRLAITDRERRTWTLPLENQDVARAQAALDRVDIGLSAQPAAASQWPTLARSAAAIAMLGAALAGHFAAVIVALFAVVAPHRPLVVAAAVACIAGGLTSMRDGGSAATSALAIAAALTLLVIAWRDRRDDARSTWRLVGAIGVLALIFMVPVLFAGADLLSVHQAARRSSGAITLALAFAAATLLRPSAVWRIGAAVSLLIAATVGAMGSSKMLDAYLDDAFLAQAGPLASTGLPASPSSEFESDLDYGRMVLSPSATSIVIIKENGGHDEGAHIGRIGEALKAFEGDSATFLDDSYVLVSRRGPTSTTLRLIDVVQQSLVWELPLDIIGASLSIDRDGAAWQALGIGVSNSPLRITGSRDGLITSRKEWTVPAIDEESAEFAIWSKDDRVLINSRQYVTVGASQNTLGPFAAWMFRPWRWESRLVMFEGRTSRELMRSALDVNCHVATFTDEWPLCNAHDGSRTHISLINPDAGVIVPVTMFPSRLSLEFSRGWATGFAGGRPYALNPSTRELVVVDRPPDEAGRPGFLVNGDVVLGLVDGADAVARVRLYRGFGAGRAAMR